MVRVLANLLPRVASGHRAQTPGHAVTLSHLQVLPEATSKSRNPFPKSFFKLVEKDHSSARLPMKNSNFLITLLFYSPEAITFL